MPTRTHNQSSFVVDDIERHNLSCVTLKRSVDGWLWDSGAGQDKAYDVPAGSVLVSFFRDVAALWLSKYGDKFPCDVLWPDGTICYMALSTQQVLGATEPQESVSWDADAQKYVPAK